MTKLSELNNMSSVYFTDLKIGRAFAWIDEDGRILAQGIKMSKDKWLPLDKMDSQIITVLDAYIDTSGITKVLPLKITEIVSEIA